MCGSSATRLAALFRDPRARALAIAEINSAGNLHRYLARCTGLRFSEFGSTAPGVPSQDLMQLTYADASFDLVITSDTLEHVPDIDRALRETCRVLRRGGLHVFSVPVVWDRPTRQRATLNDDVLVHLLPPSHHGRRRKARATSWCSTSSAATSWRAALRPASRSNCCATRSTRRW